MEEEFEFLVLDDNGQEYEFNNQLEQHLIQDSNFVGDDKVEVIKISKHKKSENINNYYKDQNNI